MSGRTREQRLQLQEMTFKSVSGLVLTEYVTAPQWQFPLYIFRSSESCPCSFWEGKDGGWYGGLRSCPVNGSFSSELKSRSVCFIILAWQTGQLGTLFCYWEVVEEGLTLMPMDLLIGAWRLLPITEEPQTGQNFNTGRHVNRSLLATHGKFLRNCILTKCFMSFFPNSYTDSAPSPLSITSLSSAIGHIHS